MSLIIIIVPPRKTITWHDMTGELELPDLRARGWVVLERRTTLLLPTENASCKAHTHFIWDAAVPRGSLRDPAPSISTGKGKRLVDSQSEHSLGQEGAFRLPWAQRRHGWRVQNKVAV